MTYRYISVNRYFSSKNDIFDKKIFDFENKNMYILH